MNKRRQAGSAIVETAASMSLMIPLMMVLLFVVLESSQAYIIKEGLGQAARQAARDLAVLYGQDQSIVGSRGLQDAQVFDRIRIFSIVNDAAQFDDPVFDTLSDPATVKVTVRYLSGEYGLPKFPRGYPINLGPNYVITGESTYRLE